MTKPDDYQTRLKKLADAKTSEAFMAADKEATLFRQQLDKVADLSDEGEFAKGLSRVITQISQNNLWTDFSSRFIYSIRQALIQFLQLKYDLPYDVWEAAAEPDKSAPDENNIFVVKKAYVWIVGFKECDNRQQDIEDILWMFGRLARNIKSQFLPRIIQLITDIKDAIKLGKSISEQESTHLIDEFITCWKLVMTEAELLDPEELLEVWPKRPTHEDPDKYTSLDTDGLDAEEATDESRDRAWKIYCRELKDFMLPKDSPKETRHPLEYLSSSVIRIADEVERGEPSTDAKFKGLDYDTLARVLSTNMRFSYDCYEMDETDGGLVETICDEPTPENDYKKQIIENLSRYLNAACLLAKKIGSSSYNDFAECQAIFTAHHGDFHDYFSHNKLIAARDLKKFITLLKRARPMLWADNENYKPNNTPIPAIITEVAPEAGKSLRSAMQDPGGRPKKTEGGAKIMSQSEMARAFGEPCNKEMVANWEARAAGKKRGANPPDAIHKGMRIIYSAELRTNPTPDNKERLGALIVEFQSRHRLKSAIGEKTKTIHCRTEETLYQARKKHGA